MTSLVSVRYLLSATRVVVEHVGRGKLLIRRDLLVMPLVVPRMVEDSHIKNVVRVKVISFRHLLLLLSKVNHI